MKHPRIQNKDGFFDLVIRKDDEGKVASSTQTLLTTMLFTQPWWAYPGTGSLFEVEADGINTNDTKKNIEIEVESIKAYLIEEKLVKEFDYTVSINADSTLLSCSWTDSKTDKCEKMDIRY